MIFFKVLKDLIKILIFWKILNFNKNRDNRKVFRLFFLILNPKCALKTFLQMS